MLIYVYCVDITNVRGRAESSPGGGTLLMFIQIIYIYIHIIIYYICYTVLMLISVISKQICVYIYIYIHK